MIRSIKKRDGSLEEFSPSKVNKWGQWASKDLNGLVDWSMIVLHAVSTLPEVCTSQELQMRLIDSCIEQNTSGYNKMAGKLYSVYLSKKIHGDTLPTIKQLHEKLIPTGLMRHLDYSDSDYALIEKMIDHERDFESPYFELHHVRMKYSLRNKITGEEFETQQFVYMRMAMALAEDQPAERRMEDLQAWYDEFSNKRLNAPTPNFVNLGTPLRGFASCCLYTTNDSAISLAIGDHIAYMMTCMSAGIGSNINTRSLGDPVRGGAFKHQGKLPYYRASVGAVKANLQNGRGGAHTTYFSIFDPEADVINKLQNPKSTEDKKIRGIDYGFISNKFFARKAGRNQDIFVFNSFTAPDLYAAMFSPDEKLFEKLYAKYEADHTFKKLYVNARNLLIDALNQAFETGRHYELNSDEINRHTPFKEPIVSSNLCAEISEPTSGYESMLDLYSEVDHGKGEVALCSLGAAVVCNIHTPEQYRKTMYYGLLMIDKCIHQSEYILPHVGFTAKQRLNAGVGITGLAYHMAKKNLKYSSPEGKAEIHRVAEQHAYFGIEASLQLGKELGNAPWMHKTKWPEGWLPIDTYNRNVDSVAAPIYVHNWEDLRARVIANKGIRNSCLFAHMPCESSSKASGAPNSLYGVRQLAMLKTDNEVIIDWVAPDGDIIGDQYELAWDIPSRDMTDVYAIVQKFTDQGISADYWRKIIGTDTVSSTEMIDDYLYRMKMGVKSKYYQNTLTTKGTDLNSTEQMVLNTDVDTGSGSCDDGVCKM